MKPEIKTKWIAALRSGEYIQGIGELKSGDEYCCLGVLCDLHKRETGVNRWLGCGYMGAQGVLPGWVVEWAGLKEPNPRIKNNSLAEINDEGASFEAIAELIEQNL